MDAPSSLAGFARLLRELRELKETIKRQTEAIHAANEAACQDRDVEKRAPILRAELHIPEHIEAQARENQEKRSAQDTKNYKVQLSLAIGTWCAFIAAIVLAWIAWGQWTEMRETTQEIVNATKAMREQNELILKQLKSQSARLTCRPGFGDDEVLWECQNDGHIQATSVRGSLTVTRKYLPSEKLINSATVKFDVSKIAPLKAEVVARTYLAGLAQAGPDLHYTRQTLRFEGEFSYNDGFEERGPESFCVSWLTYSMTPESRTSGWFPCELIQPRLRWLEQRKAQAQQ